MKYPPSQTNSSSLPPIGNLSPISEIANPQTENIITTPNIPDHNNLPVVVSNPQPRNLKGKQFPRVIVTDHKVQLKLNAQSDFLI